MTAGGGGGGATPFFFFTFVLVGLKEACMSNFSFLGSFSGTFPGGGWGWVVGEKLKIKLNSAQLELDLGLSLAKYTANVPMQWISPGLVTSV